MEKIKVESSNLDFIGFDKKTNELSIWFNNRKGDSHYKYKDVDFLTYSQLLIAESKGKFFASEIKGKFEFEKIEDE